MDTSSKTIWKDPVWPEASAPTKAEILTRSHVSRWISVDVYFRFSTPVVSEHPTAICQQHRRHATINRKAPSFPAMRSLVGLEMADAVFLEWQNIYCAVRANLTPA